MDVYKESSSALMCDEEGEVDVSKLAAKAEALEAERRRKEILQALKKRQARLGFSDEEESGSSEVVAEAELQKEEKKKGEVKNEKKNHHQEFNLIKDYFREPAVEVEEKKKKKKTRAYFKPRTLKRLKLAVLVSMVVAVLMAVLPEKKEIVWNN